MGLYARECLMVMWPWYMIPYYLLRIFHRHRDGHGPRAGCWLEPQSNAGPPGFGLSAFRVRAAAAAAAHKKQRWPRATPAAADITARPPAAPRIWEKGSGPRGG